MAFSIDHLPLTLARLFNKIGFLTFDPAQLSITANLTASSSTTNGAATFTRPLGGIAKQVGGQADDAFYEALFVDAGSNPTLPPGSQ